VYDCIYGVVSRRCEMPTTRGPCGTQSLWGAKNNAFWTTSDRGHGVGWGLSAMGLLLCYGVLHR